MFKDFKVFLVEIYKVKKVYLFLNIVYFLEEILFNGNDVISNK